MTRDTLGDCPACHHVEASYDDWEWLGYSKTHAYDGKPVRVVRCRFCDARFTPDAPEGEGRLTPFAPYLID